MKRNVYRRENGVLLGRERREERIEGHNRWKRKLM